MIFKQYILLTLIKCHPSLCLIPPKAPFLSSFILIISCHHLLLPFVPLHLYSLTLSTIPISYHLSDVPTGVVLICVFYDSFKLIYGCRISTDFLTYCSEPLPFHCCRLNQVFQMMHFEYYPSMIFVAQLDDANLLHLYPTDQKY